MLVSTRASQRQLTVFDTIISLVCVLLKWKNRVKCTLVKALRLCTGRTAHRGTRGIALLFHDHGTRRGWGLSITPRPLFAPPGKTRYPLYRMLGGPQGQSGQVWKISPPPGFDPWSVRPVASRCIDCATHCHVTNSKLTSMFIILNVSKVTVCYPLTLPVCW